MYPLSVDEERNKISSSVTAEYCSPLKCQVILTHSKTWVDLEDFTLSKIIQLQQNKHVLFWFL